MGLHVKGPHWQECKEPWYRATHERHCIPRGCRETDSAYGQLPSLIPSRTIHRGCPGSILTSEADSLYNSHIYRWRVPVSSCWWKDTDHKQSGRLSYLPPSCTPLSHLTPRHAELRFSFLSQAIYKWCPGVWALPVTYPLAPATFSL